MKTTQLLISTAIAGLVATVGMNAQAQTTVVKEKCYGIAKKGLNDCGNTTLSGTAKDAVLHSCAGKAPADNLADEWVYVAKGTCAKTGGMLRKASVAKPVVPAEAKSAPTSADAVKPSAY
jgi:uncharacterized membrane protein